MKKLVVLFCLVLVATMAMGQIPSLMEVTAENFEPYFQSEFKNVLNYVPQGVDTILLGSSGFVYTTKDTLPMVIKDKVVIMAKEGLAEKPIFTHPNSGFLSGEPNDAMEIFRLLDDVEFIGVAFMGGIDETEGCKYGLRYGDYTDPVTENILRGKTAARFIFEDCDFIGFHSLKDDALQGNVLYYLRPDDLTLDHLRNTIVKFNNCYFEDIGDEAIRISENEKYGGINGVNPFDTLMVTNCTFNDIDAECIRVYGDLDTSNSEGLLLAQHCTVVNSSPRFIYAKNYKKSIVKDILIANGRAPGVNRPERGDFNIDIRLPGSRVSHIDTFNVVYTLPASRIKATQGGYVDESTIYGHDPQFVDFAGSDFTITSGSILYSLSSDGTCIGDLNWAPYLGTGPVVATKAVPEAFKLKQNYPNPFNPVTTISFDLPSDGYTSLKIMNIIGRVVDTPVDGYVNAGNHEVRFNAATLPSGVYFYELTQGNRAEMKKMVLMK